MRSPGAAANVIIEVLVDGVEVISQVAAVAEAGAETEAVVRAELKCFIFISINIQIIYEHLKEHIKNNCNKLVHGCDKNEVKLMKCLLVTLKLISRYFFVTNIKIISSNASQF